MAIKNTSSIPISKLLEDNNSKTQFFSIPKYQREYTWGKKEWVALFNDVLENGKDYFLGSIISVCDDSVSQDYPVLEIIDGQQRITTLSILLAVLYQKVAIYKNKLRDDEDDRYDKLRALMKQLVYKKKDAEETVAARLEPQIDNSKDFKYVLLKCGLLDDIEQPKNFGNRKIAKAYCFFIEQINLLEEEEKVKESFDECSFLFDLIEKFNSAIIVNIEVSNNRDAYMLFESLNHRGIPLSAIDLIKNSLIRVSAEEKKDTACYNTWQSILKNLTEEYSIQERFFRQFYNAFREDLNTPFKKYITNAKTKYFLGPLATRTTLLDIYEQLIKNDYDTLLKQLKEKSAFYSTIINNNKNCSEILKKPLLDLERIQGAPSYILLLYIFSKKEELCITDDVIKQIVEFLVKFFVRRNITDSPGTRNLTSIFMDTVDLLASKRNNEVYATIYDKLVKESSTSERFKEKLSGKVYEDNVDAVRFLLNCYEEKFFTKEKNFDLWRRDDKNKYVLTIEHVFPEGEKIPECWVNMIAGGDKDLAKSYQDTFVHTIGNLTLTGFNSNLSNKDFVIKKNFTDSNQLPAGYNNGFKLNETIFCEEIWTVDRIQARTNALVDFFMKEFAF